MMNLYDLEATFCDYLLTIKNYRATTVSGYRHSFKAFHNALPDVERLDQISPILAQQFFFWGCNTRHWKPATFITHHKHLNVFCAWAVKNGVISTNPFSSIEKPRLEKKLPTRLSRQDAINVIDAAANLEYHHPFLRLRNHAVFAVFLYCGLRKYELLKLVCRDVDLDNLIVSVRQGKGNKDRVVPIPHPLKTILARYFEARNALGRSCPLFFISMHKDCGFTHSGLIRLIRRIEKATGTKFYPHMLRHTFATQFYAGSKDIVSLQDVLGHKDITTTMRYTHVLPGTRAKSMEKNPLNEWF